MTEKIRMKKIIANVFYVLKFSVREDPAGIISFIAGNVAGQAINAVFSTLIIMRVINSIIGQTPFNELLRFLFFAAVVMIVIQLLDAFTTHFLHVRMVRCMGNIQRRFFGKSANMDLISYDKPEYFDDYVIAASQSGEMMWKAVDCISQLLANGTAIFAITAIIFTVHPVIAIFPVAGFIINITTRFAITRAEYEYDMKNMAINRKSGYSQRIFYQPEYAKEIKLSDIDIPLKAQFNEAIDEEIQNAKKYGVKIALLSLVNWISVFTTLRFFSIPVFLGFLALVRRTITMGDVVAMQNASNIIQWRLDQTNYVLIEFHKVGMYAERFRRFINYRENIETFVGEAPPETPEKLEIKNVSFSYDEDGPYVLKDINMTIDPGEKIAIVGENGAGKTTFVKLLMRLYDVTEGQILYGGKDIREYTTAQYRGVIGAVLQDFQLYAASLAENIQMDIPRTAIRCTCVAENQHGSSRFQQRISTSYEERGGICDCEAAKLIKALESADFAEKFKQLPDGLQTELTREFSDSGTMLSGGESQKVAISRLFAKSEKLPIAILDEPSSALDPVAEYNLNRAMAEKAEHSAIVFISHRLSTTRAADRIYMFEHGAIAEQGSHDELMGKRGKYAEMFEKQAHYYKLKL